VKDEIILEIKNLKTYFYTYEGVAKAVDGVSYKLAKGEPLGVVGESGCGKSVTALSILRLIPTPPGKVVGGKIFFKGENLLEYTEDEMRKIRGNRISMIFQEPMTSLNPVFTVGNQIQETLQLHQGLSKKEALEKSIEMLRLVNIPSPEKAAERYPHELSGGQRQRIGIARALALNPKLIIGDEPVSALDVSIQAQVINLLEDIQKEFTLSYMIIAHDLAVVEHVCDRIAVMYLGRIVELAKDRELYTSPLHPYTVALLSAIPVPDPNITKKRIVLEGDVPSPMRPPMGCHFHTRCPRKKEVCERTIPELREIKESHFVACHLS